jgi:hypothetical protein
MGYYGRRYMQARTARQNNPELVERIEKTAARGTSMLTDWERNFLGSMLESVKKWGRLTAKQHEVYQRIEKKTDPEVQAAMRSWREGFTPEMRGQLVFAANYYKANPPYFGEVADHILTDKNYTPSEKLFRKMVQNRYVQRALANAMAGPKFAAGSIALVRDNDLTRDYRGRMSPYRNQMVVVIEVEDDVKSATKGARKITVLPVGGTETIITEERCLKAVRG